MYGWVWRHLPGRAPVRALIAVAAVVAVVAALFMWVFPVAAGWMPFADVVVD